MHDSRNRRSRYKRQPSGKNYQITKRDIEILSLMYRYRYLTSKDMIAFLKPKNPKRFTERLGLLFHDAGLLNRPKEQWDRAGSHYAHNVYELSAKSNRLLAQQGHEFQRAVIVSKDRPNSASPQFAHALKINQVICEAEITTLHEQHQRFVPLDEIRQKQLAKGKPFKLEFSVTIPISKDNPHGPYKTLVRPDGLYGIEYTETDKKLYRFFAIEVENTSPKQRRNLQLSSFKKKRLAYATGIKSGNFKMAFGVPNLTLEARSEAAIASRCS